MVFNWAVADSHCGTFRTELKNIYVPDLSVAPAGSLKPNNGQSEDPTYRILGPFRLQIETTLQRRISYTDDTDTDPGHIVPRMMKSRGHQYEVIQASSGRKQSAGARQLDINIGSSLIHVAVKTTSESMQE